MWPKPLLGWLRLGLTALVVLAFLLAAAGAALWWTPARLPPQVDAGDLAADPEAYLGSEVIVTGEWRMSQPSDRGYLMVFLRDRDGGRVVCHFEDVPAADRAGLEMRLFRLGEVAVRGRCDGVEDGHAVLRGCRLLD
jgi:hypothetical protein